MKNTKKRYESPQLTMVTFKVEHGFTQSNPSKTARLLIISASGQPQSSPVIDSRGAVSEWTF